MKRIKILVAYFIIFSSICQAQTKAVTETGNEVILYKDGTWKYTKDFEPDENSIIKTNSLAFHKSSKASFLLKAKNGNIGLWIDPKKWSFGKAVNNPSGDFEFEHKGLSLAGVIISEPVEIPLESFEQIAFQNGQTAAPDLKILHKEFRKVNDLKILHLQMEGTQMGIKFSYYSYYFSNANSSVQFLVTSYSSLMKKNIKEVDELLNGLVEIESTSSDDVRTGKGKDTETNVIISQGSYSPNDNCKKHFEGKWNYMVKDERVDVERTYNKTIEYMENRKYLFEYTNKWIDNCRYELIFKRTTNPKYGFMKSGEIMTVEILAIDPKEMKYSLTVRGTEISGDMIRSD